MMIEEEARKQNLPGSDVFLLRTHLAYKYASHRMDIVIHLIDSKFPFKELYKKQREETVYKRNPSELLTASDGSQEWFVQAAASGEESGT